MNRTVDKEFAINLINNQFLEVMIAPAYDHAAIEAFKEKENIRVISVEDYQKNNIANKEKRKNTPHPKK